MGTRVLADLPAVSWTFSSRVSWLRRASTSILAFNYASDEEENRGIVKDANGFV
jgi:hypothetical protein